MTSGRAVLGDAATPVGQGEDVTLLIRRCCTSVPFAYIIIGNFNTLGAARDKVPLVRQGLRS